jgi:excisionase family DNA binding protein
MKPTTHKLIEVALAADDTVSADDRSAILAFCSEPWPRPDRVAARAEPAVEAERYLRLRDAAMELGVSTRTVRRWIARGRLAPRRVMGRYRIPRSAIRGLYRADVPAGEISFPDPTAAADFEAKGQADSERTA